MTGGPDGNPIKARRWSPSKDGDMKITNKSDRLNEEGDRMNATAVTVATWVESKLYQLIHIIRLT